MATAYRCKRGDFFRGNILRCRVYDVDENGVKTVNPTFDFTGFQVVMKLKKSENDVSVVYDFTPVANTSVLGQMDIPFSIMPNITRNFEKFVYKGDVEIFRVNPIYPNQTVFDFTLSVELDISQPNV